MKTAKFGLIGKNISYSFSKKYFTNKFKDLGLQNYEYDNYDFDTIAALEFFLLKKVKELKGFNITIPYKESVIPLLNSLSKTAKKVGSVNTVKVLQNGQLKGYNTDVYGFKKSVNPLLKKHHKKVLILGTGGASKAVAYVFKKKGLKVKFVSRSKKGKPYLTYNQLTKQIIKKFTIIVNCTPLGTFPDVEKCPNIPYQYITKKHILFDLIYNPSETLFLRKGKNQGAQIQNGSKMLVFQAEKAWKLWNEKS